MNKKKRIVIAGGGTAGWMAAAAFARLMQDTVDVTLVESDAIPTIGVGEATIPSLHLFHKMLGIDEREFMAATNATFKLGIQFENWKTLGDSYIHSFGKIGKESWAGGFHNFWLKGRKLGLVSDIGDYTPEHLAARKGRFAVVGENKSYAYHMDAGLYAKFLRKLAEKFKAKRLEGTITRVNIKPENGYIESLSLQSGQVIEGDIFIDCTGFSSLLIEKALHGNRTSFSNWMLCDRAIAVQTESVSKPVPYTRSIAHESGWQWRIPLQNRVGNGLVFSSAYMSDDEAIAKLLANIDGEPLNEPRVIPFSTSHQNSQWIKNCISMGLAAGFIEPLESTGIHLFQRTIIRLLQFFPQGEIRQSDINEFNNEALHEMDHIKDFIILHYSLTERTDSEFWRYCKNMPIPDTLKHRMETFARTGRVPKAPLELFAEDSWVQVMLGQGIMPKSYHPVVDRMPYDDLKSYLDQIGGSVKRIVDSWPDHNEFIEYFCDPRNR